MRSDNVTKGRLRAPHRSLFKALGLTDYEMDLPKIGIISSYNEVVPGHIQLNLITDHVKSGVRLKGGVPLEINTIAICDGIAMNHEGMKSSLPSREIIADSVEASVMGMPFDALVFVPACDKVVPGMMMAAARLNLPSIFISGGPMLAGKVGDKKVALTDVFEAAGRKENQENNDYLKTLENEACPTCGSCAGMYTANTMNCMTEGLGLALPGNGTIPAVYSKRHRLAKETGMKIMDLLNENKTAREMMTENGFYNAIALDMALGGSSNTALHLPAIAYEAEVNLKLESFDKISKSVRQIVKLSPAVTSEGNTYFIEDLDNAGGVHGVLNILDKEGKLKDNPSISSDNIRNDAKENPVYDNEVIRSFDKAFYDNGGLAVLTGNIAKSGSIVKAGAVDKNMLVHSGPAKVFTSEEDAVEAMIKGDILKGDVIVITYEGPKGGPGMREMLSPTSILVGLGLDKYCALITDGRFSGGSKGAAIGHVSPEAISDGNIGLIENGDIISIDIPNTSLNVKLTDEELDDRRKRKIHLKKEIRSKFLKKYAKLVSSAAEGAVLKCD